MSNSSNSSMFDSLTVSAPALGDSDMTSTAPPAGGVISQPVSNPGTIGTPSPVLSSYSALPVTPPTLPGSGKVLATGTSFIGSTRLIARVDPPEFLNVVNGAPAGTIVLQTAQGKSATRAAGDRFVVCVGGIVFITNSASSLRFPGHITAVKAAAVLCEGRPLSNEDYM